MLAVLLTVVLSVDFNSLDWIRYAVQQDSLMEVQEEELSEGSNNVQLLGRLLMSRYVLPFELAGLLLLVALMGAAFIAKRQIDS